MKWYESDVPISNIAADVAVMMNQRKNTYYDAVYAGSGKNGEWGAVLLGFREDVRENYDAEEMAEMLVSVVPRKVLLRAAELLNSGEAIRLLEGTPWLNEKQR